jgi:hypothetical protein
MVRIPQHTMMVGTQYFAPIHLPTAAEGGWKSTNVMKNKLTARFKSSAWAPISVVKPKVDGQRSEILCPTTCSGLALGLRISDIAPVKAIEEIQQGQKGQEIEVKLAIEGPVQGFLFWTERDMTLGDILFGLGMDARFWHASLKVVHSMFLCHIRQVDATFLYRAR